MSTVEYMVKKKSTSGDTRKGDRHKPGRQIRVRDALIKVVDKLAERNATTPPEEVNLAVRERLERLGLWPPPGHKD